MDRISPWLPKEAYTDAAISHALIPVLETWGRRWFQEAPCFAAEGANRGKLRDSPLLSAGTNTASATAGGEQKRALIETALGLALQSIDLGPRDHELLDAFAQHMMNDFLMVLRDVGADAENEAADHLTIEVKVNARPGFCLRIDKDLLSRLIKNGAPDRRQAQGDLTSRTVALHATRVDLNARVGTATLTLGELRDLEPGDVVRLRTKATEPVQLCLAAEGTVLRTGRLVKHPDRVDLELS